MKVECKHSLKTKKSKNNLLKSTARKYKWSVLLMKLNEHRRILKMKGAQRKQLISIEMNYLRNVFRDKPITTLEMPYSTFTPFSRPHMSNGDWFFLWRRSSYLWIEYLGNKPISTLERTFSTFSQFDRSWTWNGDLSSLLTNNTKSNYLTSNVIRLRKSTGSISAYIK